MLYLGTVVTGSGPHAGDARLAAHRPRPAQVTHAARRRGLPASSALTVGLLARRAATGATAGARAAGGVLLGVELAQGAIGFVQYFTDLPDVLVGLHMLGAALDLRGASTVVVLSGTRTACWTRSASEQRVERDGDEQQRQVEVRDVEQPHRLDHARGPRCPWRGAHIRCASTRNTAPSTAAATG